MATRSRHTADQGALPISLQFLVLLGGFALLIGGAEALVRGAVRLSKGLGVSSLVVGLTVVALGTSAPEMFVSVIATLRGEPAVALGNVIGSNVFNIAVIMALGAVISPIHIELRLLQLEIPFVLFITMLFPLLATDGTVGRVDAGILLGLFATYLFYVRYTARAEAPRDWPAVVGDGPMGGPGAGLEASPRDEQPADGIGSGGADGDAATTDAATNLDEDVARGGGVAVGLLFVIAGLGAMAFGGRLIVDTATELARAWGISERVIGLTLVAGGTSLPELASTLVAFARREADLAVGSLLGSNVFNTLAILGTAAMVHPLGPTAEFLRLDMLVMLLTVVLLIPLARSRARLGRWEGLGLFMIYVAYMTILIINPAGV